MFQFLKSNKNLLSRSAEIFELSPEDFFEKQRHISSSRRLRKSSVHWGEKIFFDYLKGNNDVGILEVGSNDCAHTKRFLQETTHNVFAMELNPHSFGALNEVKKLYPERFNFVLAGASNTNEVVEFPIFSSFQGRNLNEMSGITGVVKRMSTTELGVSHFSIGTTIRIEQLFENNLLSKRNALWIDVEGHALQVLEGIGSKYLRNCELIYVEVESEKFFETGPNSEAVYNHMLQNGFTLIFRDFQTSGQFNLIFLRKDNPIKFEDDIKKYLRDVNQLQIDG